METKSKQRGRPVLPADERRTELLILRLNKSEKEAIDSAGNGDVSKWARSLLLKAAAKQKD